MPWTKDPDAWVRLGAAVRAERERQGMLQEELAEKAEVSVGTVRNAEWGRVPKGKRWPQSLNAIERALGWEVGSMQAVLEGQEPIRLQQDGAEGTADEPAAPQGTLLAELRTIGWLRENGQEVLQEALQPVHQFGHLCALLGAPEKTVDAYNQVVGELVRAVASAQGWREPPGGEQGEG